MRYFMTKEQTVSWILLAIEIASQEKPTDIKGISMIADGINHAVPTHKELQESIGWLISNGLVLKLRNKYELSSKGKELCNKASEKKNILVERWRCLEIFLSPLL